MIDSNLPRFSQGVQAAVLSLAFLLDLPWLVVVVAVVLIASAVGGPRWNLLAHVYSRLPIPRGEMEPAAPPRFAQTIGALFLTIAGAALYGLERETTTWWVLGWGPALAVAVLAGLAASTAF